MRPMVDFFPFELKDATAHNFGELRCVRCGSTGANTSIPWGLVSRPDWGTSTLFTW
jgi:hypothetical protein